LRSRRCLQRLAKPDSRDPTPAKRGALYAWRARQSARPHASYAVVRCLSAGAGIAMRAFPRCADCEQSKPLARRSQSKPPRASIRVQAIGPGAGEALPMLRSIAAIGHGREAQLPIAMRHGSCARSCRSSMLIRYATSPRPRGYRSRHARGSAPGLASRIRGIGRYFAS
jgi:hypothetical protein